MNPDLSKSESVKKVDLNDQIEIAPPVMNNPLENIQALNPQYTEQESNVVIESSSWMSYNIFFVLIMVVAASFLYKFKKKQKGDEEDEFIKSS